MIVQIRGLGAFLLGMCLWSNVAHAQFRDNCTFQPDCAVAAPNCAVAAPSCAVSCETICAPRRPPIRYKVSRPKPFIPSAPITYEVGGGLPCQNVGCTEMGCAETRIGCANMVIGCDNAIIGCDNVLIGCDNRACNNANCKDANCLGGPACLAKHVLTGLTAAGGAAIDLVGGTTTKKYRRASRKWYYKSFSRHRHLNYPIISPANHPTYGVYQTCWDRFPEEALWCPPCYNTTSAANLYTTPQAYPTATPPTKPLIVPPAAPAAEPITPPENPPAAPPADSLVPTTSAAILYGP